MNDRDLSSQEGDDSALPRANDFETPREDDSSTPCADDPAAPQVDVRRRQVLKALAGLGVGGAVFQRALAAQAAGAVEVTPEMIRQSEWIAGLDLSDEQRAATARGVNRSIRTFETLRAVELDNSVPPAIMFSAAPW